MGNYYEISGWSHYKIATQWIGSFRSTTSVQTSSKNQSNGFIQSMAYIGVQYFLKNNGHLTHTVMGVEYGIPIVRWASSQRLFADNVLTVGIQQSF